MSSSHRASRRAAVLLALAGSAAAQTAYFGIGSGLDGAGDLYGHGVAQLHDVNGDDINDVLIGAPGNDDAGAEAGAAFVVSGLYGAVLYQVKGKPGDELGWSVANLGDVNGDGIDDFTCGRPGRSVTADGAGAVSVYSGADGALMWTQDGPKVGARLGSVVACSGDVDGDGRGDVLAGAPDYDGPLLLVDADWGRALLYSGDNGQLLATYTGTEHNDRLGAALASVGDLTGDDRSEFAIGVPGKEVGGGPLFIVNAGSCQLYNGATHALMGAVDGGGGDEACGSSIAAVGDTDHDGQLEFAVGRPGWSNGRGRVSVHESKALKQIAMLDGPQISPNDEFGTAVCGAGDVNKDGFVDLLVGAPSWDTGFGGYSQVYSGKDWTQWGQTFNSYADWGFGAVIAAGLDTTDDGWPDALFGMPNSGTSGVDSGYAWGVWFLKFQPNIELGGPGSASLFMYGTPLYSGGLADLRCAGAPAFTPVFLLASGAEQPIAFKGGVVVPQLATSLMITLVTDVKGRWTITDIPGGTGYQIVFLQALMKYPGAPQGWWFTNAVAAEFLP